jgi:hypothetical protein
MLRFYHFMQGEYKQCISDKTLTSKATTYAHERKGIFRDRLMRDTNYRYKQWSSISNKAKYFRMLSENIRHAIISQEERVRVSTICQRYDYNANNMHDILNDCHDERSYPTYAAIRNICRSRSIPALSTSAHIILDWSTQDTQTIRTHDDYYDIQVLNEWVTLHVPIPSTVRPGTGRVAKPRVRMNDNGELMIDMSYEIMVTADPLADNDVVMGVDLGIVKPFAAASLSTRTGEYSTELTISRELQHYNNKKRSLDKEIRCLYEKIQRIEPLITLSNAYLTQHYHDIKRDLTLKKNKRTRLKKHMQWCIARDITTHATREHATTIIMEDLRWTPNSKWDHSITQERITQTAQAHKMRTIIINPKNTSRTDPFTNTPTTPNTNRTMTTTHGPIDRDYAAALNITQRTKKTTRPLTQSRDKHAPTPKRPRNTTRNHVHKLIKQARHNSNGGYPITVSTSHKERLTTTLLSNHITTSHARTMAHHGKT